MSQSFFGKPRPLWRVILLSGATLMLYYGWYKWIIQEELKRYNGYGWSGTLSLLPFVIGVALPQILWRLDPDVEPWFGWFSLLGIVWIYIVQFKLYRTVNELYKKEGLKEPLIVWWLFIPGLNLIVGLQQIHFLAQYWAKKQAVAIADPIARTLPFLFVNGRSSV
jgi:hypothetical protein